MAKLNDIKVSRNFKLYEFECHDGNSEVKVDPELVEKLQALREKLGRTVVITSGYRTPEYNAKIGGVSDSQHIRGKAADIKVASVSPEKVAQAAEEIGFDGIGIYDTFTHVDVRGYRARWRG